MQQQLLLVVSGETVIPTDVAHLLVSSITKSVSPQLPPDFKHVILMVMKVLSV